MRDFTLHIFRKLCILFHERDYKFLTFAEYCSNEIKGKFTILRHDVDRKPESALEMAILENHLGIRASYYFRVVKASYDEAVIRKIAKMGHEIGYHYEDLVLAKGNAERAITMFENNLKNFLQLYPVKTICMHGSPLSRWDNRLLWQYYDYRNFGIIGEPYFDIDFNEIFYLTDTGRCWNGSNVNIRDKVKSKLHYNFKSTFDIIEALNNNELPNKIMINVHPHRWDDQLLPWLKELFWQNAKNVGKYIFVRLNK